MRIKFICLNLWLGGKLFDNILEFLEQEKPDILAVQEAYNWNDPNLENRFRSLEVLKDAGFEYVSFSPTCVAKLPVGDIEAGNAIVSKFPITQTETRFFDVPFGEVENYEEPGGDYSRTPRNIQHAKIKIQDKELNVFNTQGIWGVDGNDDTRRLQMVDTIKDFVKGRENVILAGDFNFRDNTESAAILEQKLKNVFKDKIKTSFNTVRKENPVFAGIVVDMVFVSEDVKIVDSRVPQADVSDHLPLVVEIEIA